MNVSLSIDHQQHEADGRESPGCRIFGLKERRPNAMSENCRDDILAILQAAGRRLTTPQILSEMDARNTPHGESTVKAALARLVRELVIDNRRDASPRGYAVRSSERSNAPPVNDTRAPPVSDTRSASSTVDAMYALTRSLLADGRECFSIAVEAADGFRFRVEYGTTPAAAPPPFVPSPFQRGIPDAPPPELSDAD